MSRLPPRALRLVRSPVLLVYALVFTNALLLTMFVPLVPIFSDEFGLSKVEASALFTSLGVAIIIVAIPLGFGADRVGARTLTVGAAALEVISALGQGLAVDFWSLLAARLVFGTASTMVLIAGVAWLADSVSVRNRSRALGAIMPVAGIGALMGPALGGALADTLGREAPFLVGAALALVVFVALLLGDHGTSVIHARQTLRELFGLGRAEHAVVAAALLMLIGGLAETVVNILGPLQLDENGVSASLVGAALSLGAGLFVLVSLLVARVADRAVRIRYGAVAAFAVGIALIPLVLSTTTAAILAGAVGRLGALGVVYTIAFPLGALGAYRAGLGRGSVTALLMLASGVANTVGPLASGAIAEAVSDAAAYMAVIGACVLAAVWMAMAMAARTRATAAARAGVSSIS